MTAHLCACGRPSPDGPDQAFCALTQKGLVSQMTPAPPDQAFSRLQEKGPNPLEDANTMPDQAFPAVTEKGNTSGRWTL